MNFVYPALNKYPVVIVRLSLAELSCIEVPILLNVFGEDFDDL